MLVRPVLALPLLACSAFTFQRLPPVAGIAAPALVVQSGHSLNVSSIAVSPDGKYVVSADQSLVIVWDKASGRQLRALPIADAEFVYGFTLSFVNATTVTVTGEEGVVFFDVRTGARTARASNVSGAASPDGRTLAAWERKSETLSLVDLDTGAVRNSLRLNARDIATVNPTFAPDGRLLAVKEDDVTRFIDPKTGATVFKMQHAPGRSYQVAIARDGIAALESDEAEAKLTVFEHDGRERWRRPLSGVFFDLAFHPNGDTIALGTKDGALHLLDAKTGDKRREPLTFGRTASLRALCFAADGSELFVGIDRDIAVLHADSLQEVQRFVGRALSAPRIALSDDARFMLLGTSRSTLVWDLRVGRSLRALEESDATAAIAIQSNGRRAALLGHDDKVRLYELPSGKPIVSWTLEDKGSVDGHLALSPDGTRVAVSTKSGVAVFDVASARKLGMLGDDSSKALAYSPDGKRIATARLGELVLYDAETLGEQRAIPFTNGRVDIDQVVFSADGNALGALQLGEIATFDVRSGKELQHIDRGKGGGSWGSIALSPDGARVYAGDFLFARETPRARAVRAYENSREVAVLGEQIGWLGALRTSGDGRLLLGSASDNAVTFWDTGAQRPLATLTSLGGEDWAVASADGRFDSTERGAAMVVFVEEDRVLPLTATYERAYTPHLLARLLAQLLGRGQTGALPEPPPAPPRKLPTPPVVALELLSGESTTSSATATVRVTVVSPHADPELRLFHNGKRVLDATRGVQRKLGAAREIDVPLTPGDNEIVASALDADGIEGRSRPMRIVRTAPQATARLFVIAVGVDAYVNPKYRLSYARKDARAFVERIETRGRGIFSEIVRKELYDEQASRAGIEAALREIATKSRPEDVLVFFYAGHGVMSEGDVADFHLVLPDVKQMYGSDELTQKGMPAKALKELLVAVPARKTLLLLDACESGGAVDTFATRGAAEEKAIFQLSRAAGIVVLSATGSNEAAGEVQALGHGIFTYALLEGLDGAADGAPKDNKITVKELEAFVGDRVPALTEQYRGNRQIPNSFTRGQDFPVGTR